MRRRAASCILLSVSILAQSRADYPNFESPQVHPIDTVVVGGKHYALVCNTPDNALEVYEIGPWNQPTLTAVGLFKTGLEPVSVAVKPSPTSNGTVFVYTANWLGDSVSVGTLIPTAGGGLSVQHLFTQNVGDEPMQVAFMPELPGKPQTGPSGLYSEHLVVAFGANGTWGMFHPFSLAAINQADASIPASAPNPDPTEAVQAGRTLAFSPPTSVSNPARALFLLNQRGGHVATPPTDVRPPAAVGNTYDFDLWQTEDPFAAAAADGAANKIAGLGTTNFNMAFAQNGDLFVVGQRARNLEVPLDSHSMGESIHRSQVDVSTGFAPSLIWRVRQGQAPEALDLNAGSVNPIGSDAITQPTDVLVYERSGEPTRVFIAGFASDTIGVLTEPNGGGPLAAWIRSSISVAHPTNAFSQQNTTGIMRGPRGLAVRQDLDPANDALLVYSSVEHSVLTIPIKPLGAPSSAILLHDPVPDYIRSARKFLYSSKLSSRNNASCATCHPDGHTDQLDWNLSDGVVFQSNSSQSPGSPLFPGALYPNPGEKNTMVTQSLRGLVDFELEDQKFQKRIDNAPYHWRGDRASIDQFNGTFANLMGGATLSAADMQSFRIFLNSIHYPPNPEQPKNRRYSGDPGSVNDPQDGTLAQRGQKAFHMLNYRNQEGFASCISCHTLPEGSDNRLTEPLSHPNLALLPEYVQNLETAATRGLIEKEKRLFERDTAGNLLDKMLVTGNVGLNHVGDQPPQIPNSGNSIRGFVGGFGGAYQSADADAVTLYLREFDTGMAPSIGRVATFLNSTSSMPVLDSTLQQFETYAREANCGLVVRAYEPFPNPQVSTRHSYYYDATDSAADPLYIEITPPSSLQTPLGNMPRSALVQGLALPLLGVQGVHHIVVECVPLGSERRAGWSHGLGVEPVPPSPQTPTLANDSLQTMRANTANRPVAQMTTNWTSVVESVGGGTGPGVFPGVAGRKPESQSPHLATALLQSAVIFEAGGNSALLFGAKNPAGHEPPRRFRIAGQGFQHGARLRIYLPNLGETFFSVPGVPPSSEPTTTTHQSFEMPIYPSAERTASNQPIWETAVEMPPEFVYSMMVGTAAFDAELELPGAVLGYPNLPAPFNSFKPARDNWVYPEVTNPGAAPARGGWQRVRIE
ncbi:MAG: hypothetical protein R3F56_25330 [Planctomycetota bacterium]